MEESGERRQNLKTVFVKRVSFSFSFTSCMHVLSYMYLLLASLSFYLSICLAINPLLTVCISCYIL